MPRRLKLHGGLMTSILAFFSVACDTSVPSISSGDLFSIRDSSGVLIVESGAPSRTEGEEWLIEEDALLQIGLGEDDERYEFSGIADIVRFHSGHIAVVDRQSMDIRIFDEGGNYMTTLGRRGDGPGEFGAPPILATAGDDTLVTWDPQHRRLTWFTLASGLIREKRVGALLASRDIPISSGSSFWQLRGDETILAVVLNSPIGEGLHPATREPIIIRGIDDSVIEMGVFPAGEVYGIRRDAGSFSGFDNPFGPRSPMVLGPDPHILTVAGPNGWEVMEFGVNGQLIRILRINVRRAAITKEMLDEQRGRLRQFAMGMGVPEAVVEDVLGRFSISDSVPAIRAMYRDTDGSLWVERRAGAIMIEPRIIDILDRDGLWTGSVTLPPNLGQIHLIDQDLIIVSKRDTLNVPIVAVHRFLRGPNRGKREE